MQCYIVPFQGQFIVYRPLRRLAVILNEAGAHYAQSRLAGRQPMAGHPVEQHLMQVGFFEPGEAEPQPWKPPTPHRPAMAVLLMTSACNLRCTYCYAHGGQTSSIAMEMPLARKVIDTAADNATARGQGHFGLTFHGGGEPTANWDVLQGSVEHARSKGLRCNISMSSNGVWTERQRRFIIDQFNNLSISFDGLPEVQDAQRPRADGQGSFQAVMQSIRALDSAGARYGLRLTASPKAFDLFAQSIAMLCQETRCPEFQVEPAFSNERGEHSDPTPQQAEAFIRVFMDAYAVAQSYGRQLLYSGARPGTLTTAFCQASADALVVTPEGDIVTCYEVHDRRHRLVEHFVVGQATPDAIQPDPQRLEQFVAMQSQRRARCTECFCYWHCAGDCATRCAGPPNNGRGRCEVNRGITRELLAWHVLENQGSWRMPANPQPQALLLSEHPT